MGIPEFILDRAKKEAVQEGRAELLQKQVKDLLHKNQFSPEQIAEILGAPYRAGTVHQRRSGSLVPRLADEVIEGQHYPKCFAVVK